MIRASAPGKVILLGEHAVVYGRPAVAVPLPQARAVATVEAGPTGSGLILAAPDIGRVVRLDSAPADDPLAQIARLTLACLDLGDLDATVTVTSSIPIAGGLGSGAAVSVALTRALAAFVGTNLPPAEVSRLAFEVEKLHHGTPSGIDNTVIAYEQPVYFVRGREPERLAVGASLRLLVADSGVASSTREMVGGLRQRWAARPAHYEALFDRIGALVEQGRTAIVGGDRRALGGLMARNHELLAEIGVSTLALDRLVEAAQRAGALGAKLSGAGGGGNVVALVEPERAAPVEEALRCAGAIRLFSAEIAPTIRDTR